MKKNQSIFAVFLTVFMAAVVLWAASPSFNAFNGNQFYTDGSSAVAIKSGFLGTNGVNYGTFQFPNIVCSPGQYLLTDSMGNVGVGTPAGGGGGSGATNATGVVTGQIASGQTLPTVFGTSGITAIDAEIVAQTLPASEFLMTNSFRAGKTNVGNNATTQVITFSAPFPATVGTNYAVSQSFNATTTIADTPFVTLKTTNGFTLNLISGISGGISVDYIAWPFQ